MDKFLNMIYSAYTGNQVRMRILMKKKRKPNDPLVSKYAVNKYTQKEERNYFM